MFKKLISRVFSRITSDRHISDIQKEYINSTTQPTSQSRWNTNYEASKLLSASTGKQKPTKPVAATILKIPSKPTITNSQSVGADIEEDHDAILDLDEKKPENDEQESSLDLMDGSDIDLTSITSVMDDVEASEEYHNILKPNESLIEDLLQSEKEQIDAQAAEYDAEIEAQERAAENLAASRLAKKAYKKESHRTRSQKRTDNEIIQRINKQEQLKEIQQTLIAEIKETQAIESESKPSPPKESAPVSFFRAMFNLVAAPQPDNLEKQVNALYNKETAADISVVMDSRGKGRGGKRTKFSDKKTSLLGDGRASEKEAMAVVKELYLRKGETPITLWVTKNKKAKKLHEFNRKNIYDIALFQAACKAQGIPIKNEAQINMLKNHRSYDTNGELLWENEEIFDKAQNNFKTYEKTLNARINGNYEYEYNNDSSNISIMNEVIKNNNIPLIAPAPA